MDDGCGDSGALFVDRQIQIEQLGVFGRLIGGVAVAFAVTALAGALIWSDWRMGGVGLVVLGYAAMASLAMRAIARQREQLAALQLAIGVFVGASLIAWIQPALGPTVAQAGLIPFTIALLQVEPDSRRYTLASVAFIVACACVALWRLRQVPSFVPDWFLNAYQVASFLAVFLLVLVLIHQWRQRYQRQLAHAVEAQARLEREATRWKATLLAQYDAVIATDEHGSITLMNSAAETMSDTKLAAVYGKHIADAIFFETDEARFGAADFFQRALETGQGYSEIRGVEIASRRGEHRSQIAVSAAPIQTEDQKLMGVIFTFRDMTDHIRLMERTQAAERMKAVERMAAGVAGELGNALNVICGSSEKIRQQLQMGEPVALESVDAIITSGQHASKLANRLLAIGQRQPGAPAVCDLGVLVADVVTEMLPPIVGRDIFVSSHNQVGLGRIRVDPEQIREALIQLAVHARASMPHGGKLEFETSNEFVDAPGIAGNNPPQLGAYVRLVVRDSGGGLDDDDLRHILEPYYAPRRKRQQSDAELRLSVVNGVIRQNGGWLSVESRLRVGSTFTMFFPRVDVQDWIDGLQRDPVRIQAANVLARRRTSFQM